MTNMTQVLISAGVEFNPAPAGSAIGTRRLFRRYLRGHPDPFRSVRDLGLVSAGCPGGSGATEGCSSVWLPGARLAGIASGFKSIRGS
jgi:hypothetical protein